MSKKCKNCGTAVEDSAKICPTCKNLGFEEIARVELSEDQIQQIVKAVTENLSRKPRILWGVTWRILLGVFALLGIPGAITGWNIWESIHKLEESTTTQIESDFKMLNQNSSNQIVKAYSEITNNESVKFEFFALEASNKIDSAYSSVTNQIAKEFQTPRIRQTVENVAKDQAKAILEGEVQPAVNTFREDASFIRTVAHAQAYDFKCIRVTNPG
jgi:ribosomal protein S13